MLIIVLAWSCSSNNQRKQPPVISATITPKQIKIDTTSAFVDSTHIATPRKNKLFLARVVIDDSIPKAYIRFYTKRAGAWKLRYSFEDDQWSGDVLDPEITDFNNDGYEDFLYLKGTGARGGNGIDNLFIYDRKGDSLIYVLNSNDCPNLYHNKQTNSINSFILTGGNETDFMRLDSNKLTPFASVFQYGDRVTVSEYDKAGKAKIVKVDSSGRFDEYARFINYKPLTVEK